MTVEVSTSEWTSGLPIDPSEWGLEDFSSGMSSDEKLNLQLEAKRLIELEIPRIKQRSYLIYDIVLEGILDTGVDDYRDTDYRIQPILEQLQLTSIALPTELSTPEIDQKLEKTYRIQLEDKQYTGIQGYHPIDNRLGLPLITSFHLRAARSRIERNVFVGDLLENPVKLILSNIPEFLFERSPRFQKGHGAQAIPDFAGIQGWKELHCFECKNWICEFVMDKQNVDELLMSRFYRFEDALGISPSDYARTAILAGPIITGSIRSYIESYDVAMVCLPAIQPRGPTTEKLRFLDWALRAILNGSRKIDSFIAETKVKYH